MNTRPPKQVAAYMVKLYQASRYSALERAGDHAFSYDRAEFGRRYWLAVADEISKLVRGAA